MFDFDAGKLLIIGIVALIFIPSKDLPRVLRQMGQFVGKMRRMAGEFQGQFMDAMREADMAELRREATQMAKAAEVDIGLGSVHELNTHLRGLIEGKGALSQQEATALGEASDAAREIKTIAPPDLVAHGAADAGFVEATHPATVAQAEPIQAEPIHAEPIQAEPIQAEPIHAELSHENARNQTREPAPHGV